MKFTGTVTEANGAGGRWVECPFDAATVFGSARPPVVGTVNGQPYRTRLARYGGRTVLGLTKDIRARAGVEEGSEVMIEIELDPTPREVEVPEELALELASDGPARAAYDALPFTHRKEYAQWIAEAKQPATRTRRAAKARQMLLDGTRHP